MKDLGGLIHHISDLQETFIIEEALKRNHGDLTATAAELRRGFVDPQPITVDELLATMKHLGIKMPQ